MNAADAVQCHWCGAIHGPRCPAVKSLEYHANGAVKRVEFYAPNDFAPKLGDSFAPAPVHVPPIPRWEWHPTIPPTPIITSVCGPTYDCDPSKYLTF